MDNLIDEEALDDGELKEVYAFYMIINFDSFIYMQILDLKVFAVSCNLL